MFQTDVFGKWALAECECVCVAITKCMREHSWGGLEGACAEAAVAFLAKKTSLEVMCVFMQKQSHVFL